MASAPLPSNIQIEEISEQLYFDDRSTDRYWDRRVKLVDPQHSFDPDAPIAEADDDRETPWPVTRRTTGCGCTGA